MNHFLFRKQDLNWEYLLSIPTLQLLFTRLLFVRLLFTVELWGPSGNRTWVSVMFFTRIYPLNQIDRGRTPNGMFAKRRVRYSGRDGGGEATLQHGLQLVGAFLDGFSHRDARECVHNFYYVI